MSEGRAKRVSFRGSASERKLVVELVDGREIHTPIANFPRLASATPEQRADWRLIGDGVNGEGGIGIHWPQLDEDLSVAGLLRGERGPSMIAVGRGIRWWEVNINDRKVAAEYVLRTDGPVHPGGHINAYAHVPGVFKGFAAERVEGIDYDAFRVTSLFVGAVPCVWFPRPLTEEAPAVDLFEPFVKSLDAAHRVDITLIVVNRSDKPLPFAVKIVGLALR